MVGRKLGRGLQFLLSDRHEPATEAAADRTEREPAPQPTVASGTPEAVALDRLDPNPWQPRRTFDDRELAGLADSIRESGVLQPLLVRRRDDRFQIIAGERRARAAKLAGLDRVPVQVREVGDADMRLLALVENLQRTDLDPIEKALSFQDLKAATSWTHERIAKAVGLDRSSVSNYLRLLELSPAIRSEIRAGRLSMGHARALLAAPEDLRARLADEVAKTGLSVRETERLVGDLASTGGAQETEPTGRKRGKKAAWAVEMEQNLLSALGCRVTVSQRGGKGRIVLDLGTRGEFDRVYELLMCCLPVTDETELVRRKTAKVPTRRR